MTVKVKFRCHFIQKADDDSSRIIYMSPVTSCIHENEYWSRNTLNGQFHIHISNPDMFNKFEQGKEYFIEINPVIDRVSAGQSIWQLPNNFGIPV